MPLFYVVSTYSFRENNSDMAVSINDKKGIWEMKYQYN